MKKRPRLNSVFVGGLCSTFWPSSVATVSGPSGEPAFTQPAGIAFSGIDSNVSVHGSGRTTRARASPVTVPTVALMRPACSMVGPDRERSVGHGAFQAIERPGRFLFAQEAPAAVERSRGQLHGPARLEDELRRRHLHVRGAPSPVTAGSFAAHPVGFVGCFEPMA